MRIPPVELAIAAVAGLVALSMAFHAAQGFHLTVLHFWVITPYLAYLALRAILGGDTPRIRRAGVIGAVAMLALTVFFYVDSLMVHTSSTSPLIFLFAPAYVSIGALFAFAAAYVILGRTEKKA